jgi:hypothetical protein
MRTSGWVGGREGVAYLDARQSLEAVRSEVGNVRDVCWQAVEEARRGVVAVVVRARCG